MVKRYFALVLSLVFCFAAVSCSDPGDISPGPTETAQPAVNTPEAAPDSFDEQLEKLRSLELPDYTGRSIETKMFDEGMYLTLINQDCDFYPDSVFAARMFYLITREPVPPSQISVELPMKNEYSVTVSDDTEEWRELPFGFTYENYLCLKGTDWHNLGNLFIRAKEADKLQSSYYGTDDQEYWKANAVSQESYNEYNKLYDEYRALSVEELPEFRVIAITVMIPRMADRSGLIDETVSQIRLSVDGKEYTANFGEWRFHSKYPDELKPNKPGVKQNALAVMSVSTGACADGIINVDPAFDFSAMKDITLTGVRTFGASPKLIGARVIVTPDEALVGEDDAEIQSADYYWDLAMPLDIPAGANVKVSIIMQDDRFDEYEFDVTMFLILDYELEERPCTLIMPCDLKAYHSCAERAIMAIEGVDLTDYYAYYYVPAYCAFIDEMPESWKK
jgi:hypothetical protein